VAIVTARLAPITFVVLWSSGFTFVAMGLDHADPLTFLAVRYVIVVALLGCAALVLRPPLPRTAAQWGHLAAIGVLLQAGYFGLLYLALGETGPADAALVVSLQPILVALLAPRLVGEHVSLARWAGLAIGLAGAAIVILSRAGDSETSFGGIALAAAALVSITASTLYESRLGVEQHPVTSNLVQYAVALAITGPAALLFEARHVAWTGELVLSLSYLVLANSLLAMTLWLAMLRRGAASQVSALFFLTPPLAAVIAWVVLGEALPVPAWLGMVLAAVGVGIATRTGDSSHATRRSRAAQAE
jgi:drug/metabolite transporter (DMT)-like permease